MSKVSTAALEGSHHLILSDSSPPEGSLHHAFSDELKIHVEFRENINVLILQNYGIIKTKI